MGDLSIGIYIKMKIKNPVISNADVWDFFIHSLGVHLIPPLNNRVPAIMDCKIPHGCNPPETSPIPMPALNNIALHVIFENSGSSSSLPRRMFPNLNAR